jgi:hypothetical protein
MGLWRRGAVGGSFGTGWGRRGPSVKVRCPGGRRGMRGELRRREMRRGRLGYGGCRRPRWMHDWRGYDPGRSRGLCPEAGMVRLAHGAWCGRR